MMWYSCCSGGLGLVFGASVWMDPASGWPTRPRQLVRGFPRFPVGVDTLPARADLANNGLTVRQSSQ
jgi:hypothetical protein